MNPSVRAKTFANSGSMAMIAMCIALLFAVDVYYLLFPGIGTRALGGAATSLVLCGVLIESRDALWIFDSPAERHERLGAWILVAGLGIEAYESLRDDLPSWQLALDVWIGTIPDPRTIAGQSALKQAALEDKWPLTRDAVERIVREFENSPNVEFSAYAVIIPALVFLLLAYVLPKFLLKAEPVWTKAMEEWDRRVEEASKRPLQ